MRKFPSLFLAFSTSTTQVWPKKSRGIFLKIIDNFSNCTDSQCRALWLFDVDISSMMWLERFWRAILNFNVTAGHLRNCSFWYLSAPNVETLFIMRHRRDACCSCTSYNHCWYLPWTCLSTVCSATTPHSIPQMLYWIATNWILHEPTTTCLQFFQLLKLMTCKSVYNVKLHAKNNSPFVPWVNWALTPILQFQNVLFITQFPVLSIMCAIFCISVSHCSCAIAGVCLPCHWL